MGVRVLCIDPGQRNTGIAIVDHGPSARAIVHCATLTTAKRREGQRLMDSELEAVEALSAMLWAVVAEWRPSVALVETTPGRGRSFRAVAAMVRAWSTCVAVCYRAGLDDVRLVLPASAKKGVTGSRTAEKSEVLEAVLDLHPEISAHVQGRNAEHVADAVALSYAEGAL